jgi:mannose-1-phosphate guanylyltransferase
MEKAENVMCVPCKAGWNDVGSYRTLREIRGADAAGNLIVSDRRVVAPGLRDTIVAVSEEGVLVLPFSRDGEIRALVASPEEPRR